MFVLILQSALLLAIAYILGCILGCLFRTLMANDEGTVAPATAVATAGVATAAAVGATPKPAIPPAPKPEPVARPPEPVALTAAPVAAKAAAPAKPKAPTKRKAAAKPKPAAKPKAVAKPKAASKPKAVAKPKATTKPKAAALRPPKAGTKVDNLKLIKGIGLQNEARLNALGVIVFQQVADWKKADVDNWGERLAFPGRIEREDWVGQAKILAKGGSTPFASRVRRGTVATSVGTGTVGDLGKKPRTLTAARKGGPDNLTLIDGVGNALEKRLFGIGIYHFDQIAKLTDDQAKWVGIAVGFPGRVERENWVAEAKTLAAGGTTDHAKRVEEGKIATSRKSTAAEKKKS